MKRFAFLLPLALISVLSACVDVNTRIPTPVTAGEAQNWHLHDVYVRIPDHLEVDERNVYAPTGDIVWREDP